MACFVFLLLPSISVTSVSGGNIGPNLCPSLTCEPEHHHCLLWFGFLAFLSRSATARFLLVHVSPVFSVFSPFFSADGPLCRTSKWRKKGKYLKSRCWWTTKALLQPSGWCHPWWFFPSYCNSSSLKPTPPPPPPEVALPTGPTLQVFGLKTIGQTRSLCVQVKEGFLGGGAVSRCWYGGSPSSTPMKEAVLPKDLTPRLPLLLPGDHKHSPGTRHPRGYSRRQILPPFSSSSLLRDFFFFLVRSYRYFSSFSKQRMNGTGILKSVTGPDEKWRLHQNWIVKDPSIATRRSVYCVCFGVGGLIVCVCVRHAHAHAYILLPGQHLAQLQVGPSCSSFSPLLSPATIKA